MTKTGLAKLILETGHHHHQAYTDADGVDPEWPLWYAAHLQGLLWDKAGRLPTRSELVHLLLTAEAAHAASGGGEPFAEFYAEVILNALSTEA